MRRIKRYGLGVSIMKYEFRNVNGHVEVFLNGSFLFSADTKSEALAEIAEMERSA